MKMKLEYQNPEIVVIPTEDRDILTNSGFMGEDHVFGVFFE